MDCERVRDRFSSLWEKDLMPSEEKTIREHLSSCPECQKELERFRKTMEWLHAVGDVEVPEGFSPELYRKIEERKKASQFKESGGKWFIFPHSFKLPAQAVAMVTVVFLVLYLTKIIPMEVSRVEEKKQTSFSVLEGKKTEQVSAEKEIGNEQRATGPLPETPRSKDVDLAKAHVPGEEKLKGTSVPQAEADIKKIEKGGVAEEKSWVASRPTQEILLRVSDREKVIPQVQELVKYFGGEMVTIEGNKFLASLPTDSFQEFEKELSGLSVSTQTDKEIMKKQTTESLIAAPGIKREGVDEIRRAPAKRSTDQEARTVVLILLIQE